MRLLQLEYFLVVVDEGSFTRAAARLMIAQPSLSQQVAGLEREVGGKLLERLPRGVRLTPAGRSFEPEARKAVSAVNRAKRAAKDALGLRGGEIEIATVLSVAVGILPPAIAAWRHTFPGVSVGLQEFRHRVLLEAALTNGQADLAIGPRPQDWPGSVVSLGYEEFVLVLASGDPVANSDADVPLSAVARYDWVLFEQDHGLSALVAGACAKAGFRPSGSIRTSQVEAAARLAATGAGVALVPRNIVPPGLDAAVLRLDPPLLREQTAYARSEFNAQAASFVNILVTTTTGLGFMTTAPPAHAWLTDQLRSL